jgi:MOSC domain-containing protein YiiM
MQVISVNVGLPREVPWHGELVETAIFKEPVSGPVKVGRLNLEGDRQADLSVHGGTDKAVYAYPSEHCPFWREELATDLTAAAFGENLTTAGVTERDLHIGDRLRVGSAEFVVTQPRTPCFKLGIRFGRADMVRRFQQSGRSGFYLAVVQEGHLTAGDEIVIVAKDPAGVTVADIVSLIGSRSTDQRLLRAASELAALPQGWRDYFRRQLR